MSSSNNYNAKVKVTLILSRLFPSYVVMFVLLSSFSVSAQIFCFSQWTGKNKGKSSKKAAAATAEASGDAMLE